MGETVKDVLAHAQWLISKGRAEEPARLLLPRIEAKRRVANKQRRTRVQWDCTPEQYSDYWAQKKRIREHVGNITMAQDLETVWLSLLKEETMDAIIEEGNKVPNAT